MMESMDIYGDFTSQEIQARVELLAAPQFLFWKTGTSQTETP